MRACVLAAVVGCHAQPEGGNPFDDGSAGEVDTGAGPATPGDTGGTVEGTGSAGDDDSSSSSDAFKFDTPNGADDGADDGGTNCNCGNDEWSYVWIANSQQSTVSKINTRTLEEEGRYSTRDDANGNPSRTSVSIDGKAVAVANRHVGIVKIWAREQFCDDHNGTAGIQTSAGKDDVLDWGEDDCVAWFTDFPGMTVQRPVQWTPGEGACHENQKIWTTTGAGGMGPGQCANDGVWVHRLDGDTGVVEDTVMIPDAQFPCDQTLTDNGVGLGPYGGAVDVDGNFWFHGFGNNKLARIDFATLEVEIFSGGTYGITVDTKGRVWGSSSLWRFDYEANAWANPPQQETGSGGLAQDHVGRMWAATQDGLVWHDLETLAMGDAVPLPGTGAVKGVSVDVDGFVWAIRQGDPRAFKIDPTTYEIEFYDGLDGPYTYSDMTGGGLYNITCNPEG